MGVATADTNTPADRRRSATKATNGSADGAETTDGAFGTSRRTHRERRAPTPRDPSLVSPSLPASTLDDDVAALAVGGGEREEVSQRDLRFEWTLLDDRSSSTWTRSNNGPIEGERAVAPNLPLSYAPTTEWPSYAPTTEWPSYVPTRSPTRRHISSNTPTSSPARTPPPPSTLDANIAAVDVAERGRDEGSGRTVRVEWIFLNGPGAPAVASDPSPQPTEWPSYSPTTEWPSYFPTRWPTYSPTRSSMDQRVVVGGDDGDRPASVRSGASAGPAPQTLLLMLLLAVAAASAVAMARRKRHRRDEAERSSREISSESPPSLIYMYGARTPNLAVPRSMFEFDETESLAPVM